MGLSPAEQIKELEKELHTVRNHWEVDAGLARLRKGQITILEEAIEKLSRSNTEKEVRISGLEAEVSRWEDHEVKKAVCCSENEQENIELKEENAVLRKALEFYAQRTIELNTFNMTTGESRIVSLTNEFTEKAREALAWLKKK